MKQSILRTISFIRGDYRSIWRDSMMMVMLVSPLLMGLGIRIIIPYINEQLMHLLRFDITPYLTGIGGFLIQVPPLMYGMVAGFLILDERDEGVLQYLTVTPLSRGGYLIYRITMPAIVGIVASLLFISISGLLPSVTVSLLPLLIPAALGAPVISLLLATFAHDKVEALTIAKAASTSFLPALVIFFTDSPIQYVCGFTPSFWIVKGMIALYTNSPFFLVYVAAGVLIASGYMLLFICKFIKKVI